MAQLVECLSNKCEVLSTRASPAKNKSTFILLPTNRIDLPCLALYSYKIELGSLLQT
jgi:hypothetical protein